MSPTVPERRGPSARPRARSRRVHDDRAASARRSLRRVGDGAGPGAGGLHGSARPGRGRNVFRQGESGDSLFVVDSGLVKLVHAAPRRRHRLLALVGPGEAFGEASTFDTGVRDATARTVTDATVLELSQARLTRWLQDRPEVAGALLRHLSRRLTECRDEASVLLVADSPTRVAVCLLQLAERLGTPEADGLRVSHGLTQVELAELVGVARETVNKVLRDFADGAGWTSGPGQSSSAMSRPCERGPPRGSPPQPRRLRPASALGCVDRSRSRWTGAARARWAGPHVVDRPTAVSRRSGGVRPLPVRHRRARRRGW